MHVKIRNVYACERNNFDWMEFVKYDLWFILGNLVWYCETKNQVYQNKFDRNLSYL